MARTFVRLNDVTYELAAPLSEHQGRLLAERLAQVSGEERLEVILPEGVKVDLRVDLSKVWASGVGHLDTTVQIF